MLKCPLFLLQTTVQAIRTGREAGFTEFYPKQHIHDEYPYKMTVPRLGPMTETACQAMTTKLGVVTGDTEAVIRLVRRPNRKQPVAHLTVGQLTTHYAGSQGNITVVSCWELSDSSLRRPPEDCQNLLRSLSKYANASLKICPSGCSKSLKPLSEPALVSLQSYRDTYIICPILR